MTHDERCVRATIAGLEHLQMAMYYTSQKKDEYGRSYPLFAEATVEEILKLRAQLDELIGLTDYLKTYGPPPADDDAPASAALPAVPAGEPKPVSAVG